MRITYMKWRYVEDYDFYDVSIELEGYAKKRFYVNSHRLDGVDMDIPDAVAFLLRATLDCQPIKGVEKTVDKRRSS
jgi:hypothetical protein